MNPNYLENTVCVKGDMIGQGAFGEVYKAKDQTGNLYALKDVKCKSNEDLSTVLEEIRGLAQTNNPNIIALHNVNAEQTKPFEAMVSLTLEYCAGGNLNERLASSSSDKENFNWMSQIINGVEYLHNQKIIHRDIKPQNILLTCQGQVKISDFGLATRFCKKSQSQTWLSYYFDLPGGGACYVSPEMLLTPQHYNYKVDIYGIGVIFYAILERTFLLVNEEKCYGVYVAGQPLGVAMHNVKSDVKITFEYNFRRKTKVLKKLIKNMLKYDYHKRQKIQQIQSKFPNFYKF